MLNYFQDYQYFTGGWRPEWTVPDDFPFVRELPIHTNCTDAANGMRDYLVGKDGDGNKLFPWYGKL